MSLYLTHRPKSIKTIVGNEHIKEPLQNMLANLDTCPHVFLFSGESGCGKTTFSRIIAKAVGSSGRDYLELDSGAERGIKEIREIRKQAQFRPIESNARVFLIDECHKLTNDAQNAMLKILEDTPEHVYFILATTEPNKLLKAIRNRCQEFEVKPLTESQMGKLIARVVKKEKEKLDEEVVNKIIEAAAGRVRLALQTLEKVLATAEENRLQVASASQELEKQSIELCRALLGNKSWKEVSKILTGLKTEEPESIRRQVLGYCQAVLLGKNSKQHQLACQIMEEFIEPFYNTGFPGLTFACASITLGE